MFSPAQRDAITAYVSDIQHELLLGHWRITLSEHPANEGYSAQVTCTDDNNKARLYLAADFCSQPPEEQRNTIVHELVHVHHHAIRPAVEPVFELVGTAVSKIAGKHLHGALERMTDSLADAIAPKFPLPSIPKE